jgi:hypothetical protein
VADPEETVLSEISKDKANRWKLKSNPEHRLKGSFVWYRAVLLKGTLTGATLTNRVRTELGRVQTFLVAQLGADRKSGLLLSDSDGPPHHLDLVDVARQRVVDLPIDINDKTSTDATRIRKRANQFRRARVRAALVIVWRAAALEPDLWSADGTLDQVALLELLDRRLRAFERMLCNVSDYDVMAASNPQTGFETVVHNQTVQPDKNWFDGFRVRLFEYPAAPAIVKQIPGLDFGHAADSTWGDVGSAINYNVAPASVTRNYLTGGSPEQMAPDADWRLPDPVAPSWPLSAGRDNRYRIDLQPQTGSTATSLIDSMFQHNQGGNSAKRTSGVDPGCSATTSSAPCSWRPSFLACVAVLGPDEEVYWPCRHATDRCNASADGALGSRPRSWLPETVGPMRAAGGHPRCQGQTCRDG